MYILSGAVLLVAATAIATAWALAPHSDEAATWAFLRAEYRYEHTAGANLTKSQREVNAYVVHVTTSCPQVLAHAPQGPELTEIRREVAFAPVAVSDRVDHHAAEELIRAITGLRWSNRALTDHVRELVGVTKAGNALPVPDVCNDATLWVASGYHTLPSGTVAFVGAAHRLLTIEVEPTLEQLLAHGEGRSGARLAHHLRALTRRVSAKATHLWEGAGYKLESALGLAPESG
jgi:hypothetical protein